MINKVDKITPSFKEDKSGRYNIFGDSVIAYKIAPYADPTWANNPTSHLGSHLNFYTKFSYNIINTPYPEGLLNTAFADIPNSVYNTGIIVLDINSEEYRTYFDGTFAIKVPLNSSYSGITSGLSATTLYTSYIWDPNCLRLGNGFCAGTIQDQKRVETNYRYTDNLLGIGNPRVEGVNPMTNELFNSRIAFLMSDNVYYTFTGGTGSSLSWSYQFGVDNQFVKGRKSINTDRINTRYSGFYDRVSGFLDVDAGLVFLWGPIAEAFDWTQFIGNQYTTGATPVSSATTIIDAVDWDYQVGVDVRVIITPEMFQSSSNPSLIGQTNCDTVFSRICFFDKNGGLLAKGVADEPIDLNGNYIPIDVFLATSGVIQDTNSRVYINPL